MGLSPDEWRRALALTGASNDTMNLLDQYGQDQPQRPPVVQLPVGTQQALERTGSNHQIPQVEIGPIVMKPQADPISRDNVPDNPYVGGVTPAQVEAARRTASGGAPVVQLPEQVIQAGAPTPDRGGVPDNPYPEARPGDRPFDPNVGTKQLQREYTQGQNQSLDSVSEQGAIAQHGLSREAELAGGLAQQRQGELDQVRQRVDENRGQQHAFEQAAAARLDKISQMVDNPPDQSKGMVLRIIGAVIANSPKFNGGHGGTGGAGIGAGLSMIGQSMAGDIKGWHDEIAANRELHESLLAQSKAEQGDSEHELRMTGALTDLGFGVYDAALKQVRAETQSEDVARASDELRNGLRQKYGQAQMEINAMRAKQGAVGARNAEDTRITQLLSQVPDTERPDLAAKLGPRAVDLLGKMQKTGANVIGMGKDLAATEATRATTDGKQNENAVGAHVAGGFEVADPQVWGSLENGTKSKFAEGVPLARSAMKKLGELRDYIKVHGTESTGDGRRLLEGKKADVMNDMRGAAGMGSLDNGVVEHFAGQLGDLTSWLGNSWEGADLKLEQARMGIEQNLTAKSQAFGLRPRAGGAPGGAPAASGQSRGGYSRQDLEAEMRRRRAQAAR